MSEKRKKKVGGAISVRVGGRVECICEILIVRVVSERDCAIHGSTFILSAPDGFSRVAASLYCVRITIKLLLRMCEWYRRNRRRGAPAIDPIITKLHTPSPFFHNNGNICKMSIALPGKRIKKFFLSLPPSRVNLHNTHQYLDISLGRREVKKLTDILERKILNIFLWQINIIACGYYFFLYTNSTTYRNYYANKSWIFLATLQLNAIISCKKIICTFDLFTENCYRCDYQFNCNVNHSATFLLIRFMMVIYDCLVKAR